MGPLAQVCFFAREDSVRIKSLAIGAPFSQLLTDNFLREGVEYIPHFSSVKEFTFYDCSFGSFVPSEDLCNYWPWGEQYTKPYDQKIAEEKLTTQVSNLNCNHRPHLRSAAWEGEVPKVKVIQPLLPEMTRRIGRFERHSLKPSGTRSDRVKQREKLWLVLMPMLCESGLRKRKEDTCNFILDLAHVPTKLIHFHPCPNLDALIQLWNCATALIYHMIMTLQKRNDIPLWLQWLNFISVTHTLAWFFCWEIA